MDIDDRENIRTVGSPDGIRNDQKEQEKAEKDGPYARTNARVY